MRRSFIKSAALLAFAAMGAGPVLAQAPGGPPGGGPPGGPRAGGPPRGGGGALVQLLVESKAFADGGIVPPKYSMAGGNTQPDFTLSNVPANAQSIAIIMHDLDVAFGPNAEDVLHWVVWNIPATAPVTRIEEGKLPTGSVVGKGMRDNAYMGMGAPAGPRYHHYVFEFYALNTRLDLPATASRAELLEAIKGGKVVAKAAYVGRFKSP
ncbi:MAG TPA: YbhB/YbcL family Raf kinase inhibitor-like protein [Steroidobacteraceae bacterium]|nr:YbhB/YbcL family Raf kinase inhibitor-like protein [Steroidobacteraceae bacterium]